MSDDDRPTILIVEDDRLLRCLAEETLKSEGYSAVGVGSGAEALIFLSEKHSYDLLITDINMPGMSGVELARIVRSEAPSMKVLVISGREQLDVKVLTPAVDFLQKPFSAYQLLERVRMLLIV